ncbi:MAG TPA: DNA polymerase III subunit gamma/tau [Methylomirabilota bacterium]|jgi:DNA polymerase-3 subunit gamma/tau|nr:DNA polymerase III subunit gamma/tau [Methylomirabilota bacterium]
MSAEAETAAPYRVLARKYRPARFEELIGQEAMVRTLSNAIRTGRLAHAFMLTGVRGVGKTTTARIIARALNCVGPDGAGGPTVSPCGQCQHCTGIAEDRHVDVIEMDAASRTSVEDIRELIEGVRYRPVMARYKVYIVDEVHMLSRSAFNALLKTLEEPPQHVKFIFATTEIRKVPVTVLSRCQRFDLRRVEAEVLADHFTQIARKEGTEIEPAAAALIARAADGSVRDGLSLLDQAIALADGRVSEAQVRAMLGLADRTQAFDLFEAAMRGDASAALAHFASLYAAGADPALVLQDLLELTHWVTRVKLAPSAAADPTVPEAERVRGQALAERLSMPVLARAWQMLLKGLTETQTAPHPGQSAEMVLVRLAYAADLPSPADLVRKAGTAAPSGAAPAPAPAERKPVRAAEPVASAPRPQPVGDSAAGSRGTALARSAPQPQALTEPAEPAEVLPQPDSFAAVAQLFADQREAILHAHIRNNLHLVRFDSGRIEVRPTEHAPPNLTNKMGELLTKWTGRRWVVSVSREEGAQTLSQAAAHEAERILTEAAAHPLVKAALETFPGAAIEAVRDLGPAEARPEGPDGERDEVSGEEP